MVWKKIGGAPFKINVTMILSIIFGMCFIGSAVTGSMMIEDSMEWEDPMEGDGEVMLLDTRTGKVTDMGKTVKNEDLDGFTLDLEGNLATWYCDGKFKTIDIDKKKVEDRYTTGTFDPVADPFTTNGAHLAFYSSWTNTFTIRETVPKHDTGPVDIKEIRNSPYVGQAKVMASDDDDFYWVADSKTGPDSVVYRYNTGTDATDMVLVSELPIEDMDADGDHIAYQTMDVDDNGTTKVMLYDTVTGEETEHCDDCSMPRLGGSVLAVQMTNGVYVHNMTSGGDRYVPEDNEIVDIQAEDDKVAWSWMPRERRRPDPIIPGGGGFDPITVLDLDTGDVKTHQPNNAIFTFDMDGDKILFLQSVIPIENMNAPDPMISTGILLASPLFLLACIGMGLWTVISEHEAKQRKKREYAAWYYSYYNPYYANTGYTGYDPNWPFYPTQTYSGTGTGFGYPGPNTNPSVIQGQYQGPAYK